MDKAKGDEKMKILSKQLAQELSERDPAFKKTWEEGALEREISAQLINIRLNLEMTQQQFADHVGMKQSFISRLENGEQNITIATLQEIAKQSSARIHVDIAPAGTHNNLAYNVLLPLLFQINTMKVHLKLRKSVQLMLLSNYVAGTN